MSFTLEVILGRQTKYQQQVNKMQIYSDSPCSLAFRAKNKYCMNN